MLVFSGLWGHCDKNGTFLWKPNQLKLDILPFLPFQMADTLELLVRRGLLMRFTVDGRDYGNIPTFPEHQRIVGSEATDDAKHPLPLGDCLGITPDHLVDQEGKGREREEEKEGKGKTAHAGPSPADLQAAWNELTKPPIAKCRELSKHRRTSATVRLRERSMDEWREVIARIQTSVFCGGQNDRGWVASFDWLLQPDTAVKVLEGKYDGRQRRSTREPRQGHGAWRDECERVHGGHQGDYCGNQTMHLARMKAAQVAS